MSPWKRSYLNLEDCFPRVSGDEPSYGLDNSYEVTFSPRERG